MVVIAYDPDEPSKTCRPIIRRDKSDTEMVELPWGLQPCGPGRRPYALIRAEGRTVAKHRCLVPASEFVLRRLGQVYSFSLTSGDWFYFAGIWRPGTPEWPEAYAILTIEANPDVVPYADRQMAVLKRERRLDWLDLTCTEHELLQPLPAGTFRVRENRGSYSRQGLIRYEKT